MRHPRTSCDIWAFLNHTRGNQIAFHHQRQMGLAAYTTHTSKSFVNDRCLYLRAALQAPHQPAKLH